MTKFRFRWIFFWAGFLGCLHSAAQPADSEKRRSADYYYRRGEVQLDKQNWHEALQHFNAALRQNHLLYDAYYSRAIVFDHLDSLNKAVTDYNIYLEFKPEHHEALFGRSQVRMRLGQYDLAKQDLMKVLKLPPGETTAIFFRQDANTGMVDRMFTSNGAKGYIYNALGLVDIKLQQYGEAILYFDSALYATPGDPEILVSRGLAHEGNRDTTAAISDYQRALRANSQHIAARQNLDAITEGKNVTVDESKWYDEAVEENPYTASVYAERAFMNFEKGNYVKALTDYNKAISLDSMEPAYFLNRGLIKEMLHDSDGAYADYTAAIRMQSDFEKAWVNRGNLLTKLGKLEDAISDYSVVIGKRPEFASAYYNRAIARNKLKQKDLACDDLHTAERLGLPVDPKAKKTICGSN